MPRFVFLSHLDRNLYHFRLPIMKALVERGHQVVSVSPRGQMSGRFQEHGIEHKTYELDRLSMNPLVECRVIWLLGTLLRELRPDILHTFVAKPTIYGNFAARRVPGVRVVASITGLGSFYVEGGHAFKRTLLNTLYKTALKRADRVIFQNRDDWDFFCTSGVLASSEKAQLIRGSGVDVHRFHPVDRSDRRLITVCMVTRLIADKGVMEFIAAARLMKERFPLTLRFWLVGDRDHNNPRAIAESVLEEARTKGDVEFLGRRQDIPDLLAASDIYCLPSYYREGLPMSVLEAMASGLPIVTTDNVGCRDTVDEAVNGFKVPVRDVQALTHALERLVLDEPLRQRMGEASRRKAVAEFSLDRVVPQHLALYEELLVESGQDPT